MTDHADTIRRALSYKPWWGNQEQHQNEAKTALDALVAERHQAIDALRRIAAHPHGGILVNIARAALTDLGEQP